MKLVENKLADNYLHEDMIANAPSFVIHDGKLVAEVIITEGYGEDAENCSVYAISMEAAVDIFIDDRRCGDDDNFGKEDAEVAIIIIKELASYILKLKQKIPRE